MLPSLPVPFHRAEVAQHLRPTGSYTVFLTVPDLAAGGGAVDTMTDGSSGFREVAIVFPPQGGQNSHPILPDDPSHFICN